MWGCHFVRERILECVVSPFQHFFYIRAERISVTKQKPWRDISRQKADATGQQVVAFFPLGNVWTVVKRRGFGQLLFCTAERWIIILSNDFSFNISDYFKQLYFFQYIFMYTSLFKLEISMIRSCLRHNGRQMNKN